jgi:hypothetical protein
MLDRKDFGWLRTSSRRTRKKFCSLDFSGTMEILSSSIDKYW